jgi:hypothetical protein
VRRRTITTAVTLVVLLLILGVAGLVGVRSLLAPVGGDGAQGPGCSTTALRRGQQVRTAQVEVSVFNAGSRAGLADLTMTRLLARGFTEGDVGNAPSGLRVKVVQVWSTRANDAAARLVARQFGTAVQVRQVDRDLGTGVDVVVGDGFRSLAKAPRAIVVRRAQAACLPSATPSSS